MIRVGKILLLLLSFFVLSSFFFRANAAGQNGTTLSATKTAVGHWDRTYAWTIDKSVTPNTWDLFKGDTGTSQYTVAVIKDTGTDVYSVDGQICVTNGGAVATENLNIIDVIQKKQGAGQFQDYVSHSVDLSEKPVLQPTESHCYPYSFEFTPVAGAQYKNVANVTITNHSSSLGTPFGSSPKADFTLPSNPTLINNTINVDDTNGQSWSFSGTGNQTYSKTFACDSDAGSHDNTATIRETSQSDHASVRVNCYDPAVTKTADTSFDRTYHWSLNKTADQSNLTLEKGQTFVVNYTVTPNSTSSDSNWSVAGTITLQNSAPIPATINSVNDVMTGDLTGTVDCHDAFPLTIPANSEVACDYSGNLPDASSRTNTATAVQQNYSYDSDLHATPVGTTDYAGSADVGFASATVHHISDTISVNDSFNGFLGNVNAFESLNPFTYSRTIGPYDVCGPQTVVNTASFITDDTHVTGESSWDVDVNVPCSTGCTLTQGYWKNHSNWPVNSLTLGTVSYTKAKLLSILKQPVAGNGLISLAHQLIAAKLNIAAGANNTVSSAIPASDSLIGGKVVPPVGTGTLKTSQVSSLVSALDSFNSGFSGVPHCSE